MVRTNTHGIYLSASLPVASAIADIFNDGNLGMHGARHWAECRIFSP